MTEAQQAYAAKLPAQDEQRQALIMELLPQVRYIARHIHERLPQHILLEDLVHAGILGLLDAVEKFDPSKNVQVKSYAKFRIRGAILDSLRELDWSPRELRRQARQVEQAYSKLRASSGREPDEHEVAAELDLPLAEFQRLLGELRGLDLGSIQIDGTGDSREDELCTYIPYAPEDDPFYVCAQGEMKQILANVIDELSTKEHDVLSLYYYEELTMKEIGAVLGVVESRVSQIHAAALIKLRARLADVLKEKQSGAMPQTTSRAKRSAAGAR
jgi:RNA polymerase sigma factor for flagellar operon FliA